MSFITNPSGPNCVQAKSRLDGSVIFHTTYSEYEKYRMDMEDTASKHMTEDEKKKERTLAIQCGQVEPATAEEKKMLEEYRKKKLQTLILNNLMEDDMRNNHYAMRAKFEKERAAAYESDTGPNGKAAVEARYWEQMAKITGATSTAAAPK
jgi:hypothetical protein